MNMASTLLARVTGVVLALPTPRTGVSTKSGSPVQWEIATANVLVAGENVTVVQLPRKGVDGGYTDTLGEYRFGVGQEVDWLVECSVFGGEVQSRALRVFPADNSLPDSLIEALTSASV